MAVIPNATGSLPVSDLRARMQVTIVREIVPVIRSELLIGHGFRGQDLNFDVRFFVTEHGVLVESDIDLGVRFVSAIVFATVSGIVDRDDVAPTIISVAGMLREVKSLGRLLASCAVIGLSATNVSIPIGSTVTTFPCYRDTFPVVSMAFG
jgi:hypothetical protein